MALPGSAAYQASGPPFNARFQDLRPAAIVACVSPEDVAEAVGFARRHGLALVPRAGGHSFVGHSSTPGMLLDLTPMRSVTVEGGGQGGRRGPPR